MAERILSEAIDFVKSKIAGGIRTHPVFWKLPIHMAELYIGNFLPLT
jgi:hypothetical protein